MPTRWSLPLKVALFVALVLGAGSLPRFGVLEGDLLAHLRPVLRFASVLLALNIALVVFSRGYRRHKGLPPGADDAILLGIRNVYYIVAAFLTLAAAITLYGIGLREVFTSLSIIAAALAITFKEFISEIIAGLIMSFSRQVTVGDYISVGAIKGRVTTLTLTKTVLLNEDDDLVHLPNTKVFGGELVNYTQRMQRRVSIEFAVALANIPSVDDFEQSLTAALGDYADLIVPGSPSLRVVQLHKDAADFKFRYTLHDRSLEVERDIRRKTSRAVINYIQSVGRSQASGPAEGAG